MTISEITKKIGEIDCCMMTTIGKNSEIHSRPMLHNKLSEIKDTLYFFSMKETLKINDLADNNSISLTYQDKNSETYIQIFGKGSVEEDPSIMQPHWDKKLDLWWSQQAYTEGICMISIKVEWIRYWFQGKDETIMFNNS